MGDSETKGGLERLGIPLESLYRSVLEASKAGIFIETLSGEILDVNEAGSRMYGYSREEMLDMTVRDIVPADIAAKLPDIREIHEGGRGVTMEALGKRKDGTVFPVLLSTAVFEVSGRRLVAVFVQDLTEVRQKEEELRSFFRISADVAYRYDVRKREFVSISPSILDLTGYSLGELPEDYEALLERLVHPGDRQRVLEGWRGACRDASLSYLFLDYRIIDKNGYVRWVNEHLHFVRQGKTLLYVDGLVRDFTTLKETREKLEERERLLSLVLSNVSDVIFQFSVKEKKYLFMSPSIEIQTGYSPEEIRGTRDDFLARVLLPDDLERYRNELREHLSKGPDAGTLSVRFRIMRKDGRIRWVHSRLEFLFKEDDCLITGVVRDITEQVEAEQKLAESESKYRKLFEQAQVGLFRTSYPEGEVLYANRRLVEMLGFESSENPIGTLALNYYANPEDRRKVLDSLRKRGYFEGMEILFRKRDGSPMYVLASGILREEGGRKVVDGVIMDITPLKNLTSELERRTEEQRILLDNIEHQVWYLLSPDECGAVNAARCAFLGRDETELIGKPEEAYLSPEEAKTTREMNLRVFEKGERVEYDQWLTGARGRRRLFHITKTPKLDKDGNVEFVVCSAVDITERHLLAERIREKQKVESLGRIAAGIAHDFNNSLMAIAGNIELAMLKLDEGSPVLRNLRNAHSATLNAADLTRQLLAYAGKTRTEHKIIPVDMNEVTSLVVDLLRNTIAASALLTTELSKRPPVVEGSPDQLQQVLTNLLLNAAEAIDKPNGRIVVRTSVEMVGEDTLAECAFCENPQPGLYSILEVEDNGMGMDEDTIAKIFEPFYSSKSLGRGLGLAAVQGIVRTHGGAILVRSKPGRGTVMRLLFPYCSKPPRSLHSERFSARKSRQKGKVLLADDQDLVLEATSEVLKEAGFEVTTAATGKEALQIFQCAPEKFDFIVLDIVMPEMPGDRVLQEIRKKNKDVKVILISGYDKSAFVRKVLDEPNTYFLQKPFAAEQLLEMLRK